MNQWPSFHEFNFWNQCSKPQVTIDAWMGRLDEMSCPALLWVTQSVPSYIPVLQESTVNVLETVVAVPERQRLRFSKLAKMYWAQVNGRRAKVALNQLCRSLILGSSSSTCGKIYRAALRPLYLMLSYQQPQGVVPPVKYQLSTEATFFLAMSPSARDQRGKMREPLPYTTHGFPYGGTSPYGSSLAALHC